MRKRKFCVLGRYSSQSSRWLRRVKSPVCHRGSPGSIPRQWICVF